MMADKKAAPAAENALSEKPNLKLEDGDTVEFDWIEEKEEESVETFPRKSTPDDDASVLIDADNPCLDEELIIPSITRFNRTYGYGEDDR